MKVILTRDVKNIGRMHDLVETTDGHALNFLIPKKMAVSATAGAMKDADMRRATRVAQKDLEKELIKERLEGLAEGKVVIKKKGNEKGHLYDAVNASEIAAAANIPEDAVKLEAPIKEAGSFDVPVAMGADFGKITVVVEAE